MFSKKESKESSLSRYIREQVRKAREEKGWSQEELAKKVYKTGSAIGDIERGRVKVSAEELATLAAYLEKPITYFFQPYFRGAEEKDLSPEEKELVRYFREIQNPVLESIALDQVKNMAERSIKADLEAMHRAAQDPQMDEAQPKKDDSIET